MTPSPHSTMPNSPPSTCHWWRWWCSFSCFVLSFPSALAASSRCDWNHHMRRTLTSLTNAMNAITTCANTVYSRSASAKRWQHSRFRQP